MRIIFFLCLFFLYSCTSSNEIRESDFSSFEQKMDTNPPKPLECKDTEIPCAGRCVDIRRDNRNCGWCEETCNIVDGEFCMNYHCVSVRDFGYNIYPRGPVEYNIKRDLPRPPNNLK